MVFNCNEQLGGVAALDFHLLTEVSNWPTVLTDTNSAQLEFTPEDVDVDAVLDENTIRALAEQKTSASGSLWDVKVNFSFLTRSESLEQILDQYQNQAGVLLVHLNNGFKKLYGSNLTPLYMNFDTVAGEQVDDAKAATNVVITGKLNKRPVYYTCP